MQQHQSSSGCSCTYCNPSPQPSAAVSTTKSARVNRKNNNLVTDRVLLRMNTDLDSSVRRVSEIFNYLSADYKGSSNYRSACIAAERSMDGTFNTEGARLRHFSGHRVKSYNPSSSSSPKEELRIILQSAGEKAKKAFLEHQNLSRRDAFTLVAAQIPVSKEAQKYFSNRDPVVVTSLKKGDARAKPVVDHWDRDLKSSGEFTFLPLQYTTVRDWNVAKSARETAKDYESSLQEIPGLDPMHELLAASGIEEKMIHPTTVYYREGRENSTVRFAPAECFRFDCNVCLNLLDLGEKINYTSKFYGA